jgi:hypothetical protein
MESTLNTTRKTAENSKLIYEYTKSLLKDCRDSIVKYNAGIASIMGFSGIILRFAMDLPNESSIPNFILKSIDIDICLAIKLVVCLFCTVSITVLLISLTVRATYGVTHPQTLINDWYEKEEERFLSFVTNTWIEEINNFASIILLKKEKINLSIKLMCIAANLFLLNLLISFIFKVG